MKKRHRIEMAAAAGVVAAGIAAHEMSKNTASVEPIESKAKNGVVLGRMPEPPMDNRIVFKGDADVADFDETNGDEDGGFGGEVVDEKSGSKESQIAGQVHIIKEQLKSHFGDVPLVVQQPWEDADLNDYGEGTLDTQTFLAQAQAGDYVLTYYDETGDLALGVARYYKDERMAEQKLSKFSIAGIKQESDGSYTVLSLHVDESGAPLFSANVSAEELGSMTDAITTLERAEESLMPRDGSTHQERIAEAVIGLEGLLAQTDNPAVEKLRSTIEARLRHYKQLLRVE